jgi:hypothetical protein
MGAKRFTVDDEHRGWMKLLKAIDDAPHSPNCENYPDLFFSDPEDGQRFHSEEVASLCGPCPIRLQCLEYGLQFADYGVWGGIPARRLRTMRTSSQRFQERQTSGSEHDRRAS